MVERKYQRRQTRKQDGSFREIFVSAILLISAFFLAFIIAICLNIFFVIALEVIAFIFLVIIIYLFLEIIFRSKDKERNMV